MDQQHTFCMSVHILKYSFTRQLVFSVWHSEYNYVWFCFQIYLHLSYDISWYIHTLFGSDSRAKGSILASSPRNNLLIVTITLMPGHENMFSYLLHTKITAIRQCQVHTAQWGIGFLSIIGSVLYRVSDTLRFVPIRFADGSWPSGHDARSVEPRVQYRHPAHEAIRS